MLPVRHIQAAEFQTYGWTYHNYLSVDMNFMDLASLLSRNSRCSGGHMGCVLVRGDTASTSRWRTMARTCPVKLFLERSTRHYSPLIHRTFMVKLTQWHCAPAVALHPWRHCVVRGCTAVARRTSQCRHAAIASCCLLLPAFPESTRALHAPRSASSRWRRSAASPSHAFRTTPSRTRVGRHRRRR